MNSRLILRGRRVILTLFLGGAAVMVTLLMLRESAHAFRFTSGAGGCGNFADSVAKASDGDELIPMVPARNSEGAVISRNIQIRGGWLPPVAGCNTGGDNRVFTTTAEMLQAGFTYSATLNRSGLFYFAGPVVSIDTRVRSLNIMHMSFENTGATTANGGGIYGVITGGAHITLTNVVFTNSVVTNQGGGLYLEVRGGSQLVIEDSLFESNSGANGGGFLLSIFDNSRVIIRNSRFTGNSAATGNGGGGRILMESGSISITNSIFDGNQAPAGNGGALAFEGIGSGPSTAWLINTTFSGNSAQSDGDLNVSGTGLNVYVLDRQLYLPAVMREYQPDFDFARITSITIDGSGNYQVYFETLNYVAQLPGQHVHFFFNNVLPQYAGINSQAGSCTPPPNDPEQCRWKLYPASAGAPATSPFTHYRVSDRPAYATQMCILVANPNHSVQLSTGNCVDLPG